MISFVDGDDSDPPEVGEDDSEFNVRSSVAAANSRIRKASSRRDGGGGSKEAISGTFPSDRRSGRGGAGEFITQHAICNVEDFGEP